MCVFEQTPGDTNLVAEVTSLVHRWEVPLTARYFQRLFGPHSSSFEDRRDAQCGNVLHNKEKIITHQRNYLNTCNKITFLALATSTDEVAEWLRRWTANPLCSARVGSNPILVAFFPSFFSSHFLVLFFFF